MHVHALNTHRSHVEKGSRVAYYSHWSKDFCLLFQHNFLLNAQNYASIMCQGLPNVQGSPFATDIQHVSM